MKTPSILPCLAILLVAALHADSVTPWNGTSEIRFSGSSTLHNWSGKVAADPFTAQVTMSGEGRPLSLKAKVLVQAAKMDTAEPGRDENMHRDMKVERYPLITGVVDTNFDRILREGKAPNRLPFTLTIMGKPQQVEGVISHWSLAGEVATFDLDFELSLKKCGIDVPAVMLVIRVGDVIKLHAAVRLVRAENH